MVRLLLGHSADIEACGPFQQSALASCACNQVDRRKRSRTLRLLLASEADVNGRIDRGRTPLFSAATVGWAPERVCQDPPRTRGRPAHQERRRADSARRSPNASHCALPARCETAPRRGLSPVTRAEFHLALLAGSHPQSVFFLASAMSSWSPMTGMPSVDSLRRERFSVNDVSTRRWRRGQGEMGWS
jgi:hypothetical protein